jgi:hypothetical protein
MCDTTRKMALGSLFSDPIFLITIKSLPRGPEILAWTYLHYEQAVMYASI